MTILSWPAAAPVPSGLSLGLIANTQTSGPSPWTGTTQTLEMPGQRWGATLTFTEMEEAEWRVLAAFVWRLGGRAGRFAWGPPAMPRRGLRQPVDPAGPTIREDQTSGPVVRSAGWQATGGFSFRAGDFLGWVDPAGRPQLHVAVDDTAPNSAGNGSFRVAPPVRRVPPPGTPINLVNPQAVWMLTQDFDPFEFQGSTVRSNAQLKIEEAIY